MTYDFAGITDPSFIKKLTVGEMEALCGDLREFLIHSLSQTGGHLSSNLGVVELTVALHKVFDTTSDRIIWDVGHQAYIHKILTGRAAAFPTLRQFQGLSGFPKRSESSHDCWETGHASTSISAAVGMAYARDLRQENFNVVAVIGDGSLTGGMAYEALNHMGHAAKKMIVILNDNEMSISQNVGVMSSLFSGFRTKESYLKTKRHLKQILRNKDQVRQAVQGAKWRFKSFIIGKQPFEEMGYKYFGPVNGHDLKALTRALNYAKRVERPIIIHVKTTKGKGFKPAEEDKLGTWHGVGPFDPVSGLMKAKSVPGVISWSQLMANGMAEITRHDRRAAVITPAMITGSALKDYQNEFPDRLIDVGIAEEHAVTMAGGMATNGMKPFVSIYSTFFKRAFDQVHHDVARQNLEVVFGVDRSGITGADGETHQGLYDIPMLRPVPNMVLMMPRSPAEAFDLLYTAYAHPGPSAIRYPRGNVEALKADYTQWRHIPIGSWETLVPGKDVILISFGPVLDHFVSLSQRLKEESGLEVGVVNARFIKPLDDRLLDELGQLGIPLLVYEESAVIGGLGTAVLEHYNGTGAKVQIQRLGIPDRFIQH